ncbi:MAG TPA: hypothetical protein ENH32_03935 [Proteobacteria bacterium]|nr:hypothetical protein BMS3Abin14_02058 [bacterium BMS3Abin14]HDL53102.1 hypothetical protein [Pseudomonadota bacterium]
MFDDFNFKVLEFEKELDLDYIRGKLEKMEDISGTYDSLGERGGRWVPDSWELPTLYFAGDGTTLEVVTKDMDIGDVENFLCKLAQTLECRIFSEHLEYS